MPKPLPETELDVRASQSTFDQYSGFTQEYQGVAVWKTVDDMDRYRQVIEATSPEVIVETGTKWGGFAAWLADTFNVDVITVDIEHTEGRLEDHPGVTFVVKGSSIDNASVSEVARLVAGRRVMVSLDSDHHAPHVTSEIRAYGPLVSPGCYLVVEDALADLVEPEEARRFGHRIPETRGPLYSIARTLVGNPAWERDHEIENFTAISHHPAGWWRKK